MAKFLTFSFSLGYPDVTKMFAHKHRHIPVGSRQALSRRPTWSMYKGGDPITIVLEKCKCGDVTWKEVPGHWDNSDVVGYKPVPPDIDKLIADSIKKGE